MRKIMILFLPAILSLLPLTSSAAERTVLPLPADRAGAVDAATLQRIYDEVKTPFKYGVVVKGEKGHAVDCPSVFRYGETWYMVHLMFDGSGYETVLKRSDDLLHWKPVGTILARGSGAWDNEQVAGYVALQNTRWGGDAQLETYDGKYWLSYLGGQLKGYETDPLMIGIAWSEDPGAGRPWHRLPEPVLSHAQADCRAWEKVTQYKSNIIHDPDRRLGFPFVMFYNGRAQAGYERIGIAVSDDMRTWKRMGRDPVIDNGSGISGDPQIVRIGETWVMFYFGAFWRPGAFDTFACSKDLAHWTRWTGKDLVAPSEPWDRQYAHKPWVVKHQGVVYHFYCAVGDQGRVIALATSRNLKEPKK